MSGKPIILNRAGQPARARPTLVNPSGVAAGFNPGDTRTAAEWRELLMAAVESVAANFLAPFRDKKFRKEVMNSRLSWEMSPVTLAELAQKLGSPEIEVRGPYSFLFGWPVTVIRSAMPSAIRVVFTVLALSPSDRTLAALGTNEAGRLSGATSGVK